MFHFALAFITAAATSLWWPQLPPASVALPLLALLPVAWRWRSPLLAGGLCGLLLTLVQLHAHLQHQLPPSLAGTEHSTQVRIIALPQATPFGWRSEAELRLADGRWQGRALLYWNGIRRPPQPGELWQLCVRLRPLYGQANPGAFDPRRFAVAHGRQAQARVSHCQLPRRLAGQPSLRARLVLAVDKLQLEQRGVLLALTLGVREPLPRATSELLLATGTSHLLSISGLHVVMLYALCLALLGGWRRYAPRLWLLALLPVMAYIFLAGGEVAALRALLMLLLVVLLRWRGRQLGAGMLLALVALLLVAADVRLLYGLSFWLSFSAMAAILLALRLWPEWRERPWWWQLLAMQLWLSVGQALVSLLFFDQASLLSPVANLLAIPWVSWLVLPLALVGVALLGLGWPAAGALLLGWADQLLLWLLQLLAWPGQWLPLAFHFYPSPLLWLLLALSLLLLLLLPRNWRYLLLPLPLLLLLLPPEQPPAGRWRLTLLDVGQALLVMAESGGQVLIYDTGDGAAPGQSAAARVLLPLLRQRGYQQIDLLVLSHADRDHSGGYADLAALMPIRQLHANHLAEGQPCLAGQRWQLGALQIDALWPPVRRLALSDNNSSCVLRLVGPGGRVLLTGDLERSGEAQLLARGVDVAAEVLVVGHHGSGSSTFGPLLEAVAPGLALISRAAYGRWRYPHPQVVERLQQRGVAMADTALDGALVIDFSDQGYSYQPWCARQRRWYRPCLGLE